MYYLINLLVSGLAVFLSARLLPGVTVDGYLTAVLVAVVLGLVNTLIKPIVLLLTLPITILTLGLFSLVINALMILLVTAIIPGFKVDGLFTAIIFGIVLAIINGVMQLFVSTEK